jgi:hypothetical protein
MERKGEGERRERRRNRKREIKWHVHIGMHGKELSHHTKKEGYRTVTEGLGLLTIPHRGLLRCLLRRPA